MLAHAEIIIRAPDRHLGAKPMIECMRKPAATALDFRKDPVAALTAKPVEVLPEEALVLHGCAFSRTNVRRWGGRPVWPGRPQLSQGRGGAAQAIHLLTT